MARRTSFIKNGTGILTESEGPSLYPSILSLYLIDSSPDRVRLKRIVQYTARIRTVPYYEYNPFAVEDSQEIEITIGQKIKSVQL